MFFKIIKIALLVFCLYFLNSFLVDIMKGNGVDAGYTFIFSLFLFLLFIRLVLSIVNEH